ncbi:MAG: excinuclease ABC subunit UvrC [Pseudomonadota bacterium]
MFLDMIDSEDTAATQADPSNDTTEALDAPRPRGADAIAAALKHAPGGPGVYRMLDTRGKVLYVGKARSVKKRVQSYTRPHAQPHRIARMIFETDAMEFVSTETETEALLLEANMIKRLRPRYNVLMRDDKSFPYILLTANHAAARIMKHRGARSTDGAYFGPFASAGAVNRTVNALQRAFLLRSCSDSVYDSRTRPCLLYQIKRCAAPCTGEISIEDYLELVDEAKAFLSGRSGGIRDDLARQMEAASEALDFERAAMLRDRLQALGHVQSHQGINPKTIDEADLFAVHQEAGQTCIQVFFFRSGQNWGNRAFFPRADKSLTASEVLESFLAQFYDDKPCPKLVLISEDISDSTLLAEALSTRAGHKVTVSVPKRGEKRELVEHAMSNAKEALGRHLAESSAQSKLLAALGEIVGLETSPRRVEVYDNSHIMGTNAVGGMIVAGPDGFDKGQYRKFNIKSEDLTPGDDYGMMREVLTRRFARLLKETGKLDQNDREDGPAEEPSDTAPPWPDLVLIDGGKGQLSSAVAVLEELGIAGDVTLAAVAKGQDRDAGREHIVLPGKEPFRLEPRDPVLHFIQRLRDEAHRFAIGSHRARRKKDIAKNPLDEIAGIGPARKRALLHHFGSAKAIGRAGLADLEAVPGVSAAMARKIYDFFHDSP